jgi:triacylglycerol lipase
MGMAAGLAVLALAGTAAAQPPADVEAKLKALGRVIAPNDTARLYRPMFGDDRLAGVNVQRDIAFGADPKEKLNVYTPATRQPGLREVLVYLPGGQGVKQMDGPEGVPFYDNIGAWGVKNGLVVVVTQYRTGRGAGWDAGAKDIAATLAWVKANVGSLGGDPNHVVIFGQSNGTTQLATYLGHPELQAAGGPGVSGAILMSGNFNILPLKLQSPPAVFVRDPAPAGAGGPPAGPPPGGPPRIDPAVQLQRSDLAGLKAQRIPIMMIASELDPPERVEMVQVMTRELTAAGHAPTTVIVPGHSHISEVTSFDTPDRSVSDPVLKFIKAAK